VIPTFIGIGPARCGTTSVYYYLRQHPQVHMSPRKETNFFAYLAGRDPFAAGRAVPFETVKTWVEYERLFENSSGAKAAGEISPAYFWWPGVADSVYSALPGARVFCILRNPIDRAYSSYRMHIDIGDESRTFEQAIFSELDSPAPDSTLVTDRYIRIGFYAAGLSRWLELFGPQQVKIFLYDDLAASADRFMQELFRFIGVDPEAPVDTSTRFNTFGTNNLERRLLPRGIGRVLRRLRRLVPQRIYMGLYRVYSTSLALTAGASPVPAWAREQLRAVYSSDILELQALTGRDLSHWMRA
jgi:hypothetical protein